MPKNKLRRRVEVCRMSDGDLVQRVKSGFQKIAEELPYIIELRKRFNTRPRGKANIAGCETWTEFCSKVLHRTDRQVRRVMAGFLLEEQNQSGHSIEPAGQNVRFAPAVKVRVTYEKSELRGIAYVHRTEESTTSEIAHEQLPINIASPQHDSASGMQILAKMLSSDLNIWEEQGLLEAEPEQLLAHLSAEEVAEIRRLIPLAIRWLSKVFGFRQ